MDEMWNFACAVCHSARFSHKRLTNAELLTIVSKRATAMAKTKAGRRVNEALISFASEMRCAGFILGFIPVSYQFI